MTARPTPDRMFTVDGRRVATRLTGCGTPVVVMLSSAGGGHDQWQPLRRLLDDTTACLSYGRPGLDGSDPLPPELAGTPRSVGWIADRLRQLLDRVGLAPPYVLTGCSIGGWIADRFAARWPDDVAGLVQIDPTMITPIPGRDGRETPVADAAGRGVLLDWQPVFAELHDDPPPRPRRAVVLSRAYGSVSAATIARHWQPLTMEEADRGWRVCQREWARRLDAIHIAATTAGHHVHVDQPDLVAHVLRAVVLAARNAADLDLVDSEVLRAGGHVLGAPTRPADLP